MATDKFGNSPYGWDKPQQPKSRKKKPVKPPVKKAVKTPVKKVVEPPKKKVVELPIATRNCYVGSKELVKGLPVAGLSASQIKSLKKRGLLK